MAPSNATHRPTTSHPSSLSSSIALQDRSVSQEGNNINTAHHSCDPALPTATRLILQDEIDVDSINDRAEFSLPPVDRGKDAWMFLAACFVMEALVWGKKIQKTVFVGYQINYIVRIIVIENAAIEYTLSVIIL